VLSWVPFSLSHVAGRPADHSNQQGWPPLFSKDCFPFTFPEQPPFEVLTACKEWVILFCIGEGPEYRPFCDLRCVTGAGKPRE